jgi:choline dehydrogenase
MARREVIVAGGAFNSPQLLQVSGLGPADLLQRHGVPVLADMPGVGDSLQDHFTFNVSYLCTKKLTLNDAIYNPVRRLLVGLNYVLFRRGFLAMNGHAGQGMVRSDATLASPDLSFRIRLFTRSTGATLVDKNPGSQFDIGIGLLHPESRGTVRIKSPDAAVAPELTLNTFTAPEDHRKAVQGFWIHRKLMETPAMRPYVAKELSATSEFKTDEEVLAYCRRKGDTQLHPTSSCRMGVDESAVVDPRLRVHGMGGMRIIDASIMPRCVGANTNATTIMIGEKGAAMALEDAARA